MTPSISIATDLRQRRYYRCHACETLELIPATWSEVRIARGLAEFAARHAPGRCHLGAVKPSNRRPPTNRRRPARVGRSVQRKPQQ